MIIPVTIGGGTILLSFLCLVSVCSVVVIVIYIMKSGKTSINSKDSNNKQPSSYDNDNNNIVSDDEGKTEAELLAKNDDGTGILKATSLQVPDSTKLFGTRQGTDRGVPTAVSNGGKSLKIIYDKSRVSSAFRERTGFSVYNVKGSGKVFMAIVDESGDGGWKTSTTFSTAQLQALGNRLEHDINTVSFGQFTCSVTVASKIAIVTCPVKVPGVFGGVYKCGQVGTLAEKTWMDAAKAAVGADKYASLAQDSVYTTVAVISDRISTGYAGKGEVRKFNNGTLILKSKTPNILLHEYLHNLGCEHSSFKSDTYGDFTCVMGNNRTDPVLNAAQTYRLGWLKDAKYVNIGSLRDRLSRGESPTYTFSSSPSEALVFFQEVIPFVIQDSSTMYYGDSLCHALIFVSLRSGAVCIHILQKRIDGMGFGVMSQLLARWSSVSPSSTYTFDLPATFDTRWHYVYSGSKTAALQDPDSVATALKCPSTLTQPLSQGVKRLTITLNRISSTDAEIKITKA